MKKLLVSGVSAAFFFTVPASHADSGNASSSAQVIQPLAITKTADLYFGGFMNAGVVNNDQIEIDDSTGVVTYNVSSHFQAVPSLPPHRASFAVTGEPGYSVAVTKTAPPISLGGGMIVQSLDDHPEAPFTMPVGGMTLYVGGRLKVTNAALVTPGTYSSGFTVTVNYE